MIGTTILLFTYALLIPTPRGRAWVSIAVIAACPVVAEILLFLTHPEVLRVRDRWRHFSGLGKVFSF